MTSLLNEIRNAFDWYGIKTVTRTDIRKSAYVLTADQVQVLEHAGVKPKREAVVPIRVIGSNRILKSTYYHSRRVGSGRRPEPRMGRAIVRWLRAGDRLLLATDGTTVFARKVQRSDRTRRPPGELEPAIEAVYRAIDPGRLLAHAKRVSGAPRRSSVVVEQFERNMAVKALVVRRSGGKCETPGCRWVGFRKDDGSPYVQVHHITFLSAGGEDTILNTCALCPNCHALAHYGPRREKLAAQLARAVAAATKRFEAEL